MLESFYSARQRYQEEEAREASQKATEEAQATAAIQDTANEDSAQNDLTKTDGSLNYNPLDPLLEDLAKSCDTSNSLKHKLETLFTWYALM